MRHPPPRVTVELVQTTLDIPCRRLRKLTGIPGFDTHNANPVITGWKDLGFTPKYERYDGGTQAQKGPMTEEQKAERKTLIANNREMESDGCGDSAQKI
jgi:hypothetical protein